MKNPEDGPIRLALGRIENEFIKAGKGGLSVSMLDAIEPHLRQLIESVRYKDRDAGNWQSQVDAAPWLGRDEDDVMLNNEYVIKPEDAEPMGRALLAYAAARKAGR
jgi:hypothetical protein